MPATPWHLLTSTMGIYAQTWTTDSDGVPVHGSTPASPTYTVRCFIDPGSAGDSLMYGRDTSTQTSTIYMAPKDITGATWTLTQKDRVVIDGMKWRVAGTPRNAANFGVLYVVTIERDLD